MSSCSQGSSFHFKIYEIKKKMFDPPEINMHDIELLLMFGELLLIVFPLLKWYHLVQNGRFSE